MHNGCGAGQRCQQFESLTHYRSTFWETNLRVERLVPQFKSEAACGAINLVG
jgi:hypothetical protein